MSASDIDEAEANYFAMCLLMPEEFVRRDITEMAKRSPIVLDDPRLDEMAKRYKVDLKVFMIRLGQLGFMKKWMKAD